MKSNTRIMRIYMVILSSIKKPAKTSRLFFERIQRFFERIQQVYFFWLQRFALPLFVRSSLLKVRGEFTAREFQEKIEKLEKEFRRTDIVKGEKVAFDSLILRRDGNLQLGYYPDTFRNCFRRFWLGLPAALWVALDFLFMVSISYKIFQNRFAEIIFCCFLAYSVISLIIIIFKHFNNLRNTGKCWGIYPRWIFVLFPSVVFVGSFYKCFHPTWIALFWLIGFVLFYYFEAMFELDDYLEDLPRFWLTYKDRLIDKLDGKKRPVCWLTLTRSLEDISNSDKLYQSLYLRKLFEEEQQIDEEKVQRIKKKFGYYLRKIRIAPGLVDEEKVQRIKKKFGYYLRKIRIALGLVDEEYVKNIQKKFNDLWRNLVNYEDNNLLLPYILQPTDTEDQISGRCLISYSEESIICVNLPKQTVDFMVEKGDLWKAENIVNVVFSYLKYHSQTLHRMGEKILSPIDPLIDPFRLQKDLDVVKKYVTSLIRFDGLLFSLRQSTIGKTLVHFDGSPSSLRRSLIFEKISKELAEMNQRLTLLKERHKEYLEPSNVILQAQNAIKITRLNRRLLLLTIVLILMGVFPIAIGVFEIKKIVVSFPQIEFRPFILKFFEYFGPILILLILAVFLNSKRSR